MSVVVRSLGHSHSIIVRKPAGVLITDTFSCMSVHHRGRSDSDAHRS